MGNDTDTEQIRRARNGEVEIAYQTFGAAGGEPLLLEVMRMLSSPNHPFDEAWARSAAELSHARAPRDRGTTQGHLAAGRASIGLYRRLGEVTAPVLILHGADDPLARVSGACAMARRLPGARLQVFAAMGHVVPRHLWPAIADAVAAHAGVGA